MIELFIVLVICGVVAAVAIPVVLIVAFAKVFFHAIVTPLVFVVALIKIVFTICLIIAVVILGTVFVTIAAAVLAAFGIGAIALAHA